MHKAKKIRALFGVISGLFILTATAEKLPPPVDGEYLANDMESQQLSLAGKVIKVKFNRTEAVRKTTDGTFAATLRSFVKPKGSTYHSGPGMRVRFPQEGLFFFKKSIPAPGNDDFIFEMTKPDREEVYILVDGDSMKGSPAVGDQFKRNGDEGEYSWSKRTEVPDLASQRRVSVSDLVLFPEQLNGKTVMLEFHVVYQIKQKSTEKYVASISSGRGHPFIPITFPAEALAFFKEIEGRQSQSNVCSIYAEVNVSPKGEVSFEAKGRRLIGEGLDAVYKW